METNRIITCIVCPRGCRIDVKLKGKEIIDIKNYQCKRGLKYTRSEVADPRRVLTTIVKVHGGKTRVLPVRSRESIPKNSIKKAIIELKEIVLTPPVNVGDIVLKNVAKTGIDVIASGSTNYLSR